MIRKADSEDAEAIAAIYNEYIINSTATFETEPVTVEEMRERITQISAGFPYLVYETGNEVAGYCYAHPWKERAAYKYTAYGKTHRRMPEKRLPCADSLHNGGKRNQLRLTFETGFQTSVRI